VPFWSQAAWQELPDHFLARRRISKARPIMPEPNSMIDSGSGTRVAITKFWTSLLVGAPPLVLMPNATVPRLAFQVPTEGTNASARRRTTSPFTDNPPSRPGDSSSNKPRGGELETNPKPATNP